MQTDYKNLTPFEVASVAMIAVGIALVALQVLIAIGPDARATAMASLAVLDIRETISEVQTTIDFYNEFAVGGMVAFMDQFYQATDQLAIQPIANDMHAAYHSATVAYQELSSFSSQLAMNYQNNYVPHGVDASVGGQIMGAYIERLSE